MKKKIREIVVIALNLLWKLGLAAVGVAAVMFIVFLSGEFKRDEFRDSIKLSDYILEVSKDGYKNIYNQREKEYTLENLDWVSHGVGEDKIGVYCKMGKRGFYDYASGKPLTNAIYNKAWNFSEGLGAVENDGMIGFVDSNMRTVIPQKFRIVRASDDWPGAISFIKGQCNLQLTPDRAGVIDKKGNWIIEPRYNSISELSMDSCRVVEKDGLYGIVDYYGHEIIEPQYDEIRIINPNVAVVAKNGYQKQITYSGTVLLPFVFDDVQEFSPENPRYLMYEVNGCRGVLDKKTYQPTIPAIYENVECISGDKFLVGLKESEEVPENGTRKFSYIIVDSHNRKISNYDK